MYVAHASGYAAKHISNKLKNFQNKLLRTVTKVGMVKPFDTLHELSGT
jgi:hypothetical protein